MGLGVQVAQIAQDFSQGTVEISKSPSDLAIQGDGFFIVQGNSGEKLYSRLQPTSYADQLSILNPLKPLEREKFLDLLVRVIEGNRALARPGAGRRKRRSPSADSSS